jgi:hypothetical protein
VACLLHEAREREGFARACNATLAASNDAIRERLERVTKAALTALRVMDEMLAHVPPGDSDPEGARWVGDCTLLQAGPAALALRAAINGDPTNG